MKEVKFTHIKNVDFRRLSGILSQRKSDLKYSENYISKESGLSSGCINNILRNRFNPSWRSIKAICDVLKIDYKAAVEVCKISPELKTGEPKKITVMKPVETTKSSYNNDLEKNQPVKPIVQPASKQGTLELDLQPEQTRQDKLNSIIHNNLERQAVEYLLHLGYRLEKPVTITKYVTL
jgi:hypothetical protein